jgi:hypothetical protein
VQASPLYGEAYRVRPAAGGGRVTPKAGRTSRRAALSGEQFSGEQLS